MLRLSKRAWPGPPPPKWSSDLKKSETCKHCCPFLFHGALFQCHKKRESQKLEKHRNRDRCLIARFIKTDIALQRTWLPAV